MATKRLSDMCIITALKQWHCPLSSSIKRLQSEGRQKRLKHLKMNADSAVWNIVQLNGNWLIDTDNYD